MGTMRLHATIVTGFSRKQVSEFRKLAISMLEGASRRAAFEPNQLGIGRLVTSIIRSPVDGYYSFFIGPSGSKDGWPTYVEIEREREKILEFGRKHSLYCANVLYSDDSGECKPCVTLPSFETDY